VNQNKEKLKEHLKFVYDESLQLMDTRRKMSYMSLPNETQDPASLQNVVGIRDGQENVVHKLC
jgi:hypothetical protein